MFADRISQCCPTFQQLIARFRCRSKSQEGMSHGVVPDNVSGARERSRNVRPLADVATNHEKCGVDVVPREHLQQPQSVDIVRPIVIS